MGCGCPAFRPGCGTEGAYWNQDCEYSDPVHRNGPDLEKCHNNTEESMDVKECWCNTDRLRVPVKTPEETATEDQQCFFRGPAISPPHKVESELRQWIEARIANQ